MEQPQRPPGITNSEDWQPAEHGASAVEYALLIALIALVVIGAVAALGQTTLGLFEGVCPALGC